MFSIPLSDVVSEFHLEKFYEAQGFDNEVVSVSEVNRPGLQLAGFFDYFDSRRIQVLGRVESSYLHELSHEEKL